MFGRWGKRRDETAAAPQPALPRAPAHMLAIREEVRAAAIDHDDLAKAVLADIRAEQLDVAYDVTDINDWINHYVARAGLSAEGVDHQRVRAVIKAQPGVTFKHCGIRVEDRYAGLRLRLKRRRGHVPEKVWVFLVSMDGYALRQSGERCSRVLIEDQAAAGRIDDPTRRTEPPGSGRSASDSRPISSMVQSVEDGRPRYARRVA